MSGKYVTKSKGVAVRVAAKNARAARAAKSSTAQTIVQTFTANATGYAVSATNTQYVSIPVTIPPGKTTVSLMATSACGQATTSSTTGASSVIGWTDPTGTTHYGANRFGEASAATSPYVAEIGNNSAYTWQGSPGDTVTVGLYGLVTTGATTSTRSTASLSVVAVFS